ncbi:disease resistance protein Pik-2-like [Phragmites australis]|uniref:disease resistance protein Pik-2-like n=1 Tax=Phragmites australis TaxID=29695 RepID=UPI002D79A6BC|nr:disease resistance protein Pik-2-like [Phragmites australis]
MEGAAQTVLSNAGQLLGAEYRLLRGVGGEVAELRDDLATMNALLRMQSEAEDGAVDHFAREWMKQLRELAYDAEDCVDLYKLRIKCRPNDGVRAWLERLLGTLLRRRRLASEISALRARAVAVSERHARYGVDRDALRRSPSLSGPPVLAASASAHALRPANGPAADHHQLVGIDDQARSLVERLKERVNEERYLKVFSIVGFGGGGKTTLAMEVCRRLEAEFPCQAMVSLSQAFEPGRDLKALLKRMLQQVVKVKTENERGVKEEGDLGGIDGLDEQHLADKLKESINDKSLQNLSQ